MHQTFRVQSPDYHETGRPGKICVTRARPRSNPGSPARVYWAAVAPGGDETGRAYNNASGDAACGNQLGAIHKDRATLRLGNMGVLARRPVTEGKPVLSEAFSRLGTIALAGLRAASAAASSMLPRAVFVCGQCQSPPFPLRPS